MKVEAVTFLPSFLHSQFLLITLLFVYIVDVTYVTSVTIIAKVSKLLCLHHDFGWMNLQFYLLICWVLIPDNIFKEVIRV